MKENTSIWTFGNTLQVIWIGVGFSLQIWIGGVKGFVVMVAGIVLFHINAWRYGKILFHDSKKR